MLKVSPPPAKARKLLRIMEQILRTGRVQPQRPETFFSYSELLERLGEANPAYRSCQRLQSAGLHELDEWTKKQKDLPKIAALTVNKKSRKPSKSFPESHGFRFEDPAWEKWWLREAGRAIRFDWSQLLSHREEPPAPVVREDEEAPLPSYKNIIMLEPPPAHIRTSRITVGDILGWLATGKTEAEILGEHPGLRKEDIRASLAYAAEREKKATAAKLRPARSFTEKWAGKLRLPEKDPSDPRLTYLLEKYERLRR